MWFNIKYQEAIKHAPKYLWKTIHLSGYLEDDLRETIDKVIRNNEFFVHPENLLIAKLYDGRKNLCNSNVTKLNNFNMFQSVWFFKMVHTRSRSMKPEFFCKSYTSVA